MFLKLIVLFISMAFFSTGWAQQLDPGPAEVPSIKDWNLLSEEKKLSLAKQLLPALNRPENNFKISDLIIGLGRESVKYFPTTEIVNAAFVNPKEPNWFLLAMVKNMPGQSHFLIEPLLNWFESNQGDQKQQSTTLFVLTDMSTTYPVILSSFKKFLKGPKLPETLRQELVRFSIWNNEFGRDPELHQLLFEIAEDPKSSKKLTTVALESLNSNRASKDRLVNLAQSHMDSQTPELAFEAIKALGRLSEESSKAKQLLVFFIQNQRKDPKKKNLAIQGLAEDQDIIWKIEDLIGFQAWRSQPRCEVLCQMAQSVLEKKVPKGSEFAEHYDLRNSWEGALDSLDNLFLLKASKVCFNQKMTMWATEFVTKKIGEVTEDRKKIKQEGFSAYKIYFEQFEIQALKEILTRKTEFKLSPKEENRLQKKMDSSYSQLNEYFDREEGLGGSAMNVYAWACTLLSGCSATPEYYPRALNYPGFQKAKTKLENWTQANPHKFPYKWSHSDYDKKRGSSARAVPANLAQFLFNPGSSVAETDLIESIENYEENLNSLVNGYLFFYSKKSFDGKPTRHNSNQDGIASYYFPSSVPYVQSAIEILLKKSENLTRPQIEKLKALREKLNLILISQVDRERGFAKGEIPFVKNCWANGSLRYVNALSGLALLSGLGDECIKLYNPQYSENDLLGVISNYDVKTSTLKTETQGQKHQK